MAAGTTLVLVAVLAGPGLAQAAEGPELYSRHLIEVVRRLTRLGQSLAVAVATLFLVVAGLRWMVAGGDPSEVDKAKRGIYGAGIGYLVALSGEVLLLALDYVNKYDV